MPGWFFLSTTMAETFDAPDMSDIPDEGWDYILRWFWSRAQR